MNLPTYADIAREVQRIGEFVPKTCWIAHVKSELGLTTRMAPNRLDVKGRKYPNGDIHHRHARNPARYYWLMLAENLSRGGCSVAMVRRLAALPRVGRSGVCVAQFNNGEVRKRRCQWNLLSG
jgi:hypothetical protein